MTLEDQLAHFDRYADQAYARCLKDFKARKADILAEARRRLAEGYDLYGEAGYHWTYADLHAAELEEYADGLAYRLMKMYQSWY